MQLSEGQYEGSRSKQGSPIVLITSLHHGTMEDAKLGSKRLSFCYHISQLPIEEGNPHWKQFPGQIATEIVVKSLNVIDMRPIHDDTAAWKHQHKDL
jgi:hypothetical protein